MKRTPNEHTHESPARRLRSVRSLSWKTKTAFLVAGAASVAALAITGPARAAESNANDHATLSIISGPNYVVTGNKPTYTSRIRINHAHRIIDATTGGDCPGQNLGKLYADGTYDINCPFSTNASSTNSSFNLTVSGTAKTWPYAGNGNSTSLSVSRALTIIDPKLDVTLTPADGSTRYDGEVTGVIYLPVTIKVKNTGTINLNNVAITSSAACPSIPTSLTTGSTATITCTISVWAGTPSATLSVNASGVPAVPAAELYPAGYTATDGDSITFQDDIDPELVRTPVTLHP